jgi:hypothetical protein
MNSSSHRGVRGPAGGHNALQRLGNIPQRLRPQPIGDDHLFQLLPRKAFIWEPATAELPQYHTETVYIDFFLRNQNMATKKNKRYYSGLILLLAVSFIPCKEDYCILLVPCIVDCRSCLSSCNFRTRTTASSHR